MTEYLPAVPASVLKCQSLLYLLEHQLCWHCFERCRSSEEYWDGQLLEKASNHHCLVQSAVVEK